MTAVPGRGGSRYCRNRSPSGSLPTNVYPGCGAIPESPARRPVTIRVPNQRFRAVRGRIVCNHAFAPGDCAASPTSTRADSSMLFYLIFPWGIAQVSAALCETTSTPRGGVHNQCARTNENNPTWSQRPYGHSHLPRHNDFRPTKQRGRGS